MASAEQIKALIKSHYDLDHNRFNTIALQLAATEAKRGHNKVATEIKLLIDKGKTQNNSLKVISKNNPLQDLIQLTEPSSRLSELIVSEEIKISLKRIVTEFHQRDKLNKYGLTHRKKILITGPPGTGKTMTASVIANEINLPIYLIYTDKLIAKYMGETASKLRQIFDFISNNLGVYFFDEFDAIGAERNRDNDVGEIRRVLNSFLQFLELDKSDSFIISATNNIEILDQALFRRFDDVLFYKIPTFDQAESLIRNRLAAFKFTFDIHKLPLKNFAGLSHAEITQACDNAIKESILNDEKSIKKDTLIRMLNTRNEIYSNQNR